MSDPTATELIRRAVAALENGESAQDLGQECREWLERTEDRDSRPIRVQLTPMAISSFRIKQRKGVDIISDAGGRHLVSIPRGQAMALRQELARMVSKPEGARKSIVNTALVAITTALDVDEVNADERVAELSESAFSLINKLVKLDLRQIGKHGSDLVVTCDTETMTNLEAELRTAIFREDIEPRDQIVLLRAHRSIKQALGTGETEEVHETP